MNENNAFSEEIDWSRLERTVINEDTPIKIKN